MGAGGGIMLCMTRRAGDVCQFWVVRQAVATALRGPCRVRPGTHLLVAVSGGADSVALLRVLDELARQRGWRLQLTVAHVQHHLRPEAEAEAAFVARLAEQLGRRLLRADIEPGADGQSNLEARARQQRYAALAQLAAQCGAEAIVTAHHADDQLETLLMRLLRGCAVAGLAGMHARRRLQPKSKLLLLRPLLRVERWRLRQALSEREQEHCEDASNQELTRDRAFLRRRIIPLLVQRWRDAPGRAGDLARHAEQVDALLRVQARSIGRAALRQRQANSLTFDRAALAAVDPLLASYVLRRAARLMGVSGDRLPQRVLQRMVLAVADQRGEVRRFMLGSQVAVLVRGDTVVVEAKR